MQAWRGPKSLGQVRGSCRPLSALGGSSYRCSTKTKWPPGLPGRFTLNPTLARRRRADHYSFTPVFTLLESCSPTRRVTTQNRTRPKERIRRKVQVVGFSRARQAMREAEAPTLPNDLEGKTSTYWGQWENARLVGNGHCSLNRSLTSPTKPVHLHIAVYTQTNIRSRHAARNSEGAQNATGRTTGVHVSQRKCF
ncbi:MAG: hypothetical protein RIR33_2625 [Pseudomonadota bacterium]|jgi:hypothetical protein